MMVNIFADSTALYDTLKEPSTAVMAADPISSAIIRNDPILPIDDGYKDYFPQNVNVNQQLPNRYGSVIEDSIYLQGVMLSAIAVLALMPESITNWNAAKLEEKSLSQRWKDHVSTAPVWDNDNWFINYVGHPVSGAWYYTMARNDGLNIQESAIVSVLMSTFVWEYGYEAFAEVPSIQDLIFTPLFGSILGEGMFVLQGKLDRQNGMIFGSKKLGNIGYFLIDPLGNIAAWMKSGLNYFHINADVTMTIQTYPLAGKENRSWESLNTPPSFSNHEREYGFIIRIQ
ncbi:MAG: hypothetical protein CJD30_09495 [Sulfuricurvum sp. PD_MW2]|jgi:hypothetical protein|uniref:DUF3943 domain-containing protein n=1 Tax=Sulfuricurvum sp. PD_MW2 TaxID=2027917 RepID=UPI000C05EC24|nr:DUF3943 domain-containing protein [Sulfuricurvum sp. PD_MW2]PHM16852.1 MAG: hypothetical protein CJD30_09495 [Sulfuricurvum sp. PD_MW2]